MRSQSPQLRDVVRILNRNKWLIVACVVLCNSAALGASVLATKQYTASAGLLFRAPGFDQLLSGSPVLINPTDPAREAATNARLVSLDTVSARTAKALRVPTSRVAQITKIEPEGQSNIVTISATDPNAAFASLVANRFAQEFIAFRRDADRAKIAEASRLVKGQLERLPREAATAERRTALESRAEQLRVLSALQTGNAELVQPADTPDAPSSPQVKRNGILGGILGLLLGVTAAIVVGRLDRRIRDLDELEELLAIPLLGAVPESRSWSTGKGVQDLRTELPPAEGESFRMLRASLRYFNVDKNLRTLLVTSAAAGEGKSTVSWYLSAAVAASGTKVALLEMDLRRPTLAGRLGLRRMPGVAEALTQDLDLEGAIQRVPVSGSAHDGGAYVDVLVAGATPPNAAELVESHKMEELLARLSDDYELVVIDTPPTSVVSDAMPLVQKVSGVIVVARLERSTRDAIRQLSSQLENLRAPVLGCVANFVSASRGAGYYDYASHESPGVGESAAGSRLGIEA